MSKIFLAAFAAFAFSLAGFGLTPVAQAADSCCACCGCSCSCEDCGCGSCKLND